MTRTEHYRACHLCEAICGLVIETIALPDESPRIASIKGDRLDTFSRGRCAAGYPERPRPAAPTHAARW